MRKSKVREDIASAKRPLRAERSWNSTISVDVQPKRHTQMSKDIQKFLLRSISDVNPDHKDRQRIVQSRRMEAINMFSCISSTLDFIHHEGTDHDLELKVVKIVLVRENLLMGLQYLNEKTKSSANVDNTCMNILESLAQIRESTLGYLEALCLWRQSAHNASILSPRIFFWDGNNYTIKIVRDLDFLSRNHLIIDALHLNAEQFRSNPLMLTNNLYDPDTWMDPVERATLDADGCPQGPLFESRLRLRFAERILLQEIELTGINSEVAAEDPASNVFLTQPPPETRLLPAAQRSILPSLDQDIRPLPFDRSQPPVQHKPQVQAQRLLKGSSALEYDDDGSYDDVNNEMAFNDLSGKSVWEEAEEERIIYRVDSDSNLAVSRASTISKSAGPGSSRLQTGSLPSSRGTTNGLPVSRPADGLEYGHDFFSGHWAESRIEGLNPLLSREEDFFAEELLNDDIFFVDDGTPVHPDHLLLQEPLGVKEEFSSEDYCSSVAVVQQVAAVKPIECLSSADLHIISNIRQPTRNLLLAGSICVILLARGSKIPPDVSWTAFVKLCNLVDVSQAMRALDLLRVKKLKMVIIKPYLQKLSDEMNLAGLESTDLPFSEFIVGNKLVAWVKQFTTVEVTRQQKSIQKPVVSKSSSPTSLSPVAHKASLLPLQQPLPSATGTMIRSDAAGPKDDSKPPQQLQQGVQGRLKVKGMEKIVSKSKGKGKVDADSDKRAVALTHLPATRHKIPKVDLQLVPFYSEVVDNIHANPVMIALLSTSPVKPQGLDRLSIKVYDIITSVECIVNVNMREYTLFQKELDLQLRDAACQFFEPTDPQWWVSNVSKILIVQGRVHNKLYVIISKKSIESLVMEAIKEREALEEEGSDRPAHSELQESSSRPRDESVRSDSIVIQSEEVDDVTPASGPDVPRDMGSKRAASSDDSHVWEGELLCRSSLSSIDAAADELKLDGAAEDHPSTSAAEDREQEQGQLPATYIAVDEMLTDLYPADHDDHGDDGDDDELYGHDFVSETYVADEPSTVDCAPTVEEDAPVEFVGTGGLPPMFSMQEEEQEEKARAVESSSAVASSEAAAVAMDYSVSIEEHFSSRPVYHQQQQPDEHTAPSQQLYSDIDDYCDPEYEDITSSVMLEEAMGSLLNNEEAMGSSSSSHNGSSDGLVDDDFEESSSSSSEFDLQKMVLRIKEEREDGVAAEEKKKQEKEVQQQQQEEEEEGEDPAVDHVAATEEEDEGENDYDDDDDASASNYDDDFDNITIKNESPGDKYEPASNYADRREYDDTHSIDSDNLYADPVCDEEGEEEEPHPAPHNNNQHESEEYDRNRDDDDYDYDNDRRRYDDDDDDDDFDMHSGQDDDDDDDDAYALRVVQSVLAEEEYGEDIAQSYYGGDLLDGNDFDGNSTSINACQPNDMLSYGDDYDSSNAYPNNQLSNADDFDTNIAQPHNQLSYADDFDSSTLLQHNDRSSYASDDFASHLSFKSKDEEEGDFEEEVPGAVAAGGGRRRYQEEDEEEGDGAYVASSSDGEAEDLKGMHDNISTDGEVGMDDVGMGLSSEGEEDAVPGPGDGLSALERVQKEFEEEGGYEDDDDTEYLIDFD